MADENNNNNEKPDQEQPTAQEPITPTPTVQEDLPKNLVKRSIETEMKKCYIDYAMSVIVGRALPDVRDGLKPVHRRIMYAMYDLGNTSNKPHKKSARVVGECFVAGTRVTTKRGLVPIEEVKVGEEVYTQSGSSFVTELYEMPKRKLIKITLDSGIALTMTPSQPVKVLTKGLKYEWKLAKDISASDHVVVRLEHPNLEKVKLPDWHGKTVLLDEDLAYAIGQFLTDGWFEEYNGRICFFSTSFDVMERVSKALLSSFGHEARIESSTYDAFKNNGEYYSGVRHQIRINSKELNEYLSAAFGFDPSWKAPTKRVPEQFFRSPKGVIGALISGMIDGDGSVHADRNMVHYGTTSLKMAEDVQILMQGLGVMSRRYIQKADLKEMHKIDGRYMQSNHDLYAIEVSGRFSKVLGKELTLQNEDKMERVSRIRGSTFNASSFDVIPFAGEAVFEDLSDHHIGSGWYEDVNGDKFRVGIKYPDGTKIRYSSDLKEKPMGRTQIEDWGIRSKMERIGSELSPFINDVLDHNVFFVGVKSVQDSPEERTYDLQVAGAHEFIANGAVVHNCLGKYHPHGDTAVYDSLVRMAQPFSLRYMLVDGQGNFGSVDGDSAAAMRYTECRLAPIADEMLADLDKETVDFVDNFDGSLKEPLVLPSKLPNLLVNGSSGIAVGMATNMPPHNLKEVVDGIVYMLENPNAEVPDLMQFIKGPDFPTGGILYGVGGILEAYQTGRGRLRVRAKTELEEHEGRTRIIVREIPYQVNKAKLIEAIADLVKDKKIEGITDLRDESDRQGMRIVIELRKDIQPDIVLNHLFKQTQMESTFGVINLALVNNEPKVLTLKELLQYYIAFRHDVIIRRTQHELAQARKREHILIALIKAVDAIDDTLRIIRGSKTPEEARTGLMARFEIDEEQAKAILDMRLQKLTGLEIEELKNEFAELERTIADLLDILAKDERVRAIIKAELLELRDEYGDERRTDIVADARDLEDEDLIPNEDMVVMITQDGYIKRVPLDTYKQQRRGGMGLMGMETKEEDFVTDMFVTLTHNYLLFFTNKGRVYSLKAFKLPVGSRQSKGKAIINLLPKLEDGEKVMVIKPVESMVGDNFLTFATKKGIIKKTPLEAYGNIRSSGIIAISLDDNDELVDTKITDGTREIILATKEGQAARFDESQVRPMGRPAHGVIGIRLDEGDAVVSMAVVNSKSNLLTITENGYGKITPVGKWEETDEHEVYRKTHRGGKGVITIKTDERNGKVISVMEIEDDDQLVVASKSSNVQRIVASEIRKTGRVAMGVRIMRLKDETDKVIAVARLAGTKEEMMVVETEARGDHLMPDGKDGLSPSDSSEDDS